MAVSFNLNGSNSNLPTQPPEDVDTHKQAWSTVFYKPASPISRTFSPEVEIPPGSNSLGIDALRYLLASKTRFGRLFWAGLLIFCLGLLTYEVVKVIVNYYTRPLSTSYETVLVDQMEFPEMQFCPMSAINWTRIDENVTLLKYAWFSKEVSGIKGASGSFVSLGNRAYSLNFTVRDTFEKFLHFGYDLDKFVESCSFQASALTSVDCLPYMTPFIDKYYGTCFHLKLNDSLVQMRADGGIYMAFNLHKARFPDLLRFAPWFAGVDLTFADTKVFLRPGSHYNIDLYQERLHLINLQRGSEHTHCIDNEIYKFEFRVINSPTYTQTNCQKDCYIRQIWDLCQCVPLLDPSLIRDEILNADPPPTFCDAPRYRDCIRTKVDNTTEMQDQLNLCIATCFPPCELIRYRYTTSSAQLYAPKMADFLKERNTTVDNIITVRLSYPLLEYGEFTQDISKSIHELISDLGNQIGLWTGASMLIFVQLPMLVAGVCFQKSRSKRQMLLESLNKMRTGRTGL